MRVLLFDVYLRRKLQRWILVLLIKRRVRTQTVGEQGDIGEVSAFVTIKLK